MKIPLVSLQAHWAAAQLINLWDLCILVCMLPPQDREVFLYFLSFQSCIVILPRVYSHFHLYISIMASLLFQTKENVANKRTEAAGNLLCIFYYFKNAFIVFPCPFEFSEFSIVVGNCGTSQLFGLKTLTKPEDLINFYLTIYFLLFS